MVVVVCWPGVRVVPLVGAVTMLNGAVVASEVMSRLESPVLRM